MFKVLTGLAMGIVIFAITIGVGTIVLTKFGGSVATCSDIGGGTGTYNSTLDLCQNASGTTANPSNTGWATTNSLMGDLGTSGLAGWTGAIIALAVGLLFIGALMGKRKY